MKVRDVRAKVFLQMHRRIALLALHQAGIDQQPAARIAEQLQAGLRRELGGSTVYIAVDRVDAATTAARALALRTQGLSVGDVAARLGLSESHTYSLIRQARLALAGK